MPPSKPESPRPLHPTTALETFARYADRVAFIHRGRATTYGDALSEVYRLARALRGVGLHRGDCVVLLADNRPQAVLSSLAFALLGCRQVLLEAGLAVAEQVHMVRDARAGALVFTPDYAARASEVARRTELSLLLGLGPSKEGADLLAQCASLSSMPLPAGGRASDIARLAYTGGSTGRSKGCCHTFRALSSHWVWQPRCWSPLVSAVAAAAERYLVVKPGTAPVRTDFMALPLLSGGTVHLLDAFEPGVVLGAVEEHRITAMLLNTGQLNELLDHPRSARTDLSSLRAVVVAGSAITARRMRQALERFGPALYQAYGMTEAGLISMIGPGELLEGPGERLLSAGRPQPGVALEIRSGDGKRLPVGEAGHVWVRTPQLMTGYWLHPELDAEALHDGWLRTGDIGRLDDDGYLFLLDRDKDMVNIRGVNCYSREVEEILTRHPAVRSVAVIGVPHERDGEAVHAVVVLAPGTTCQKAELRKLVETELGAPYAPTSVTFAGTLPLTPAGKVDKKKLRAPFWTGRERQIH
ncbi:AMP-binding protein [Streptomyces sclerotialus]|uniref:AMP-binding protein n=1 Tax=Streptomyces sclerotialus TaxID=1957 RepID=UPI0006915187